MVDATGMAEEGRDRGKGRDLTPAGPVLPRESSAGGVSPARRDERSASRYHTGFGPSDYWRREGTQPFGICFEGRPFDEGGLPEIAPAYELKTE